MEISRAVHRFSPHYFVTQLPRCPCFWFRAWDHWWPPIDVVSKWALRCPWERVSLGSVTHRIASHLSPGYSCHPNSSCLCQIDSTSSCRDSSYWFYFEHPICGRCYLKGVSLQLTAMIPMMQSETLCFALKWRGTGVPTKNHRFFWHSA